MTVIKITTDYITLGQFLKYINLASGGGDIKAILEREIVLVNDVLEQRRGRKLYPQYTVKINGQGDYMIVR